MKSNLLLLLLPLAIGALLVGGCAQPHSSQSSRTHAADSSHQRQATAAPEREMNPITGNYERQPPFGPRSVKETRQ